MLMDIIMLSNQQQPSSSASSASSSSSSTVGSFRPRTKTVRFTENSTNVVANPLWLSEEDCKELWYSFHDLCAMRTEQQQGAVLNNNDNTLQDKETSKQQDCRFLLKKKESRGSEGEGAPSCCRGGVAAAGSTNNNKDKRHYHRKLTIQCVRSAYRKGMTPEKVADVSRRCSAGCVQLAALQAIHDYVAVHYDNCPPEMFVDLPPLSSIQPTFPFAMRKRRKVVVQQEKGQQQQQGGAAAAALAPAMENRHRSSPVPCKRNVC